MDEYTNNHNDIKRKLDNMVINSVSVKKVNIGLENYGNTCYLNVIIQTLFRLNAFRTEFDKCEILQMLCQKKSFTYIDSSNIMNLKKLFHALDNKSGKTKSIRPTTFRTTLQISNNLFNNDDQQDVQEAFIMILEIIHNEISQTVNNPSTCRTDLINACEMHWYNNYSPIYNLFHGMYYVQRRCMNCANKNIKYEPNCFLGLDIPNVVKNDIDVDFTNYININCKVASVKLSDEEIQVMIKCLSSETQLKIKNIIHAREENTIKHTLQSCIDEYHSPKIIDNVQCSRCKLKYSHTCTYGITIVPKILMIQLKRFKYDGSKIRNRVSLEHTITIPVLKDLQISNVKYQLSSIINHTGPNTLCGHYYMYNYDPVLKSWYRYNDNSVTKILEINLNLTESYLLLYELY